MKGSLSVRIPNVSTKKWIFYTCLTSHEIIVKESILKRVTKSNGFFRFEDDWRQSWKNFFTNIQCDKTVKKLLYWKRHGDSRKCTETGRHRLCGAQWYHPFKVPKSPNFLGSNTAKASENKKGSGLYKRSFYKYTSFSISRVYGFLFVFYTLLGRATYC